MRLATRALVRLDDDMTAYGAATMQPSTFANLDGVSPPRRKRASAFAPVRDEGASRLATIAARMARGVAEADVLAEGGRFDDLVGARLSAEDRESWDGRATRSQKSSSVS